MNTTRDDDRCFDCQTEPGGDARASRREFVQRACGLVVAAALLGVPSAGALELPVALTEGIQSGDDRHYPIPGSDSVNIDRGAQLIVARVQGHVYVFALSCPHQNNAVKWVPNDNRFQCTKHDSRYQADGVHTSGRATRNLDRYMIRRDGDSVVVDVHRWFQSDKDPAGWAAATIAV
jgi:Rieske Fe-S protein